LAKTEYANADIDARHSAKELPLVMGRKRKLPIVLRTQKKGELREASPLIPGFKSHPPAPLCRVNESTFKPNETNLVLNPTGT
jgi:hypothetical protein